MSGYIWKSIILTIIAIFAVAMQAESRSLRVIVSVPPQKYFVERIAGDRVDVKIMIPAGETPFSYRPSPEKIDRLAGADLWVTIGRSLEKENLKLMGQANPEIKVIDTSNGIEIVPMSDMDLYPNHEAHHVLDPHIWLSPPLVMIQARNIFSGLVKLDPEGRETYETNYNEFIREVVELDLEIRNLLQPGVSFMVYHPAWGYFAEAYGLRQVTLALEGEAPTPVQIDKIIEFARDREIMVILIQPQLPTPDAQRIARDINGRVVMADPLSENWADNLRHVAELLAGKEQM